MTHDQFNEIWLECLRPSVQRLLLELTSAGWFYKSPYTITVLQQHKKQPHRHAYLSHLLTASEYFRLSD